MYIRNQAKIKLPLKVAFIFTILGFLLGTYCAWQSLWYKTMLTGYETLLAERLYFEKNTELAKEYYLKGLGTENGKPNNTRKSKIDSKMHR